VNGQTVTGTATVDSLNGVTADAAGVTVGQVTLASGVKATAVEDGITLGSKNDTVTGATSVTLDADDNYVVAAGTKTVVTNGTDTVTVKSGTATVNAETGAITYVPTVITKDDNPYEKTTAESIVAATDAQTALTNAASSLSSATPLADTVTSDSLAADSVYASATDGVSLTGDKGGDAVSVSGSDASVNIAAGDNTVVATGADARITTGKGSDLISVNANGASATTGAGDDTVIATGDDVSVNASAGGDNAVGIIGNDAVVTTGAGHDSITVNGTAANVAAGAGNNVIEAAQRDASVTAGDGRNTVTAGQDAVVSLGNGNNVVKGFSEGSKVTVGNGRNTLQGGGKDVTVSAGSGNNEISLTNGADYSAVTTGAGRDNISVEGKDATVNAGDGRDTVNVKGDDAVITAGEGNKIISVNGANAAITTTGSGKETIVAGENSTIVAGAGASSIVAAKDASVTAGAGKDTISVAGSGVQFTDYVLETDTIQLSGTPEFDPDGTITNGSQSVTIGSIPGGYYAAEITDADGNVLREAWTGETAATVDGSAMKHGYIFNGTLNQDEGDSVRGTNYDDSIYAGNNDVIEAGKGDDTVAVANHTGVTVGLTAGNGKTAITGFVTGYDDDATTLAVTGNLDDLKVSKTAVSVKGASATMESTDKFKATFNGASFNVQVADSVGATLDDETTAVIGVDKGTANKLILSSDDSTTVDLTNGKLTGLGINDSHYYKNVQVIDATATDGDNVLVGGSEKTTLIAGTGESSLWGGSSKADLLVGNTAASDVYFYGANDGNDSISGYTYSEDVKDVVNIMNADQFTGVKRDSVTGAVKVSFKNGATTEKLTVSTTATNAADVDNKYAFTTNNGEAVAVAKVGISGAANTFTYADDVDLYMGGKRNTVKVAANTDYATVDLTNGALKDLGFTGSTQQYENVSVIDASATAGDVVLAGSTAKNTIKASAGNSSLYGGFGGAADVLDATAAHESATFFYGKGDGNDTILGAGADDKVMLYDVSLGDINFEKSSVSGGVLALNNGAKLTVSGFENGTTFQLADGTSYAYDKTTGGFEQK
jgi:hypothetical protein